MELNFLTAGAVGAVLGFFAKTVIDFFVSTAKDEFKDLKGILTETVKSIETTADELNKSLHEFYTKKPASADEMHYSICRIISSFKHLGTQISIINKILSENTKITEKFDTELIDFRRESTIDIHKAFDDDFKRLEKLQNIGSRYVAVKSRALRIKTSVSLYRLATHKLSKPSLLNKF